MEPGGSALARGALAWLFSFLALSAPSEARACRCAQQSLASYYGAADVVALARVTSTKRSGNDIVVEVATAEASYKGSVAPHARFITAASSATCGLNAEVGSQYLLFGHGDEFGSYRITTCNGSRLFPAGGGIDPMTFVDVPHKFVLSQLMSLQSLGLLKKVAANEPNPTDPNSRSLVGLLDLKSLSHGGSVALHSLPRVDSAVGEGVDDLTAFETQEASYEFPAAVVYSKFPEWYRLKRKDGDFTWVSAEHGGPTGPTTSCPSVV